MLVRLQYDTCTSTMCLLRNYRMEFLRVQTRPGNFGRADRRSEKTSARHAKVAYVMHVGFVGGGTQVGQTLS